jgi:hypothetical protein
MAELSPGTRPVGRVLLSYATRIWEELAAGKGIHNRHPVAWHNFQVARALLDLGFAVDVIWFNNSRFRPRHEYDVVFDVAYALERLSRVVGNQPVRIYYPDFAHWTVHNSRLLARVAQLRERRGVVLRPGRIAPVQRAAESADHMLCRGGPWSVQTYDHVDAPILRLNSMTGQLLSEPPVRREDVRHRFIWLSGSGLVHKGLDLTLEAFARNPDLELEVFGNVREDKEFFECYLRELTELPNVRLRGWIDPAGEEFAEFASRAVGIVHPSASEMSCTAVMAGMAAGLIPVATASTDIELADFGVEVAGDSVDAVENALREVVNKPPGELDDMSQAARAAIFGRYGRDRFLASFRAALLDILNVSPPAGWAAPWDPAADVEVPEIRIRPAPT